MSDLADRAGEIEEQQRQSSLRARAASAAETPRHNSDGDRICLDCEERLSAKRLKASPEAVRCVECQDFKEKRQRGYRG